MKYSEMESIEQGIKFKTLSGIIVETTGVSVHIVRDYLLRAVKSVQDGGDPMNIFRDPAAMPDIIHGGHWDEREWVERGGIGGFREAYHRGYGIDDGDRYGPIMPKIIDMMQAIEDVAAQ